MLEEKVKEWEKTRSVSLATEICEILVKMYEATDSEAD